MPQDLSSVASYLQTICNSCGEFAHFVEVHNGLVSGNVVSSATYLPGDIIEVFRNGDYKTINVDYSKVGNIFTFVENFGDSSGAVPDGEIVTFEILRP